MTDIPIEEREREREGEGTEAEGERQRQTESDRDRAYLTPHCHNQNDCMEMGRGVGHSIVLLINHGGGG